MESLLEFEEALASSYTSNNNPLLLQTLEAKLIDRLNCPAPSALGFTELDLAQTMSSYVFSNDELSCCSKCGNPLNKTTSYKKCCSHFIETKSYINSTLEKTFWVALINNPTGTISTLPNYTTMVVFQQGLPPQLRSIVWNRLLLVGDVIPESSMLVYDNFQHSYNQEIFHQINKDLYRTFPNLEFFTKPSTIENLSTILNVYANFDAELGYCQGLLFLVGVLYYHFQNKSPALTFHSLVAIMQAEPELHDIFTTSTMSTELNTWIHEFLDILKVVDVELYNHLNKIEIEFQVFLYQWWLSFISSHIPDFSIINRIVDVCLTQGWKVGLFKISLGLLIVNKPILMTFEAGDEEVVYQHLLNESRWGAAVNDLDLFFGKTLMSWDDEKLFMKSELPQESEREHEREEHEKDTQKVKEEEREIEPTASVSAGVMGTFKLLSLNIGNYTRSRAYTSESMETDNDSESTASPASASSLSVFSQNINKSSGSKCAGENESIYSEVSTTSADTATVGIGLFGNFKFPYHLRSPSKSESCHLKELLGQALDMIENGNRNETVINEIKEVLGS